MSKLQIAYKKTLKLQTPFIREVNIEELEDLETVVYQMENYMKSKGVKPIGPMIQCTTTFLTESHETDVKIELILQADKYFSKFEPPYKMLPQLRIANCLFTRVVGKEYFLKYAYDKLNLTAFEEDIPLTGRTFTVYTSMGEDQFSADIFAECEIT